MTPPRPPQAPNPYLRTKVMTASREELRLMLLQGAERFAKAGRKELAKEKPDLEKSYEAWMKAKRIVVELTTSMNRAQSPEVVERLTALYTYIYKLLVDANTTRELKPADEAIKLLAYERETWELLMEQNRAEAAGGGVAGTTRQAAMTAVRQAS